MVHLMFELWDILKTKNQFVYSSDNLHWLFNADSRMTLSYVADLLVEVDETWLVKYGPLCNLSLVENGVI